jgi:hypothetical protein
LRTSRELQAIRDLPDRAVLLAALNRFDHATSPRLLAAKKRSLYRPEPVAGWLNAPRGL